MLSPIRKGELGMLKEKKSLKVSLMVLLLSLMATPAFARSISLKEGGVVLWVFIIIGAIIILLQLIPAAILFFSFIGTTAGLALKGKRAKEEVAEEKAILSGIEPAPVKK